VEPIAQRDREGRAALLDFARSAPAELWAQPSDVPGWRCKDVLAHIAGDTGKWFSHMLHAALDGQQLDPKRVGPGVDVDAINNRDVEERRDRTVAELVAEIQADGEEHDELLSRLTDDHQNFRQNEYLLTLGELLGRNPSGNHGGHDREHLEQLRAALQSAGRASARQETV
jgi:hypothetical protein